MKEHFKILAKHKWISNCTITESYIPNDDFKAGYRRFTATINGWRGFKIYEGYIYPDSKTLTECIKLRVKRIQERILSGDDSVFKEDVSLMGVK